MGHRRYQLKQRAVSKEETRRRILQAAVELHATIGPAETTISAIAERAGVERLTVYRHFPTMRGLFEACGALTMELYPPPQVQPPASGVEGLDFLDVTLGALYGYYQQREDAIALFLSDADRIPDLRDIVQRNWVGYLNHIRDVLISALGEDSSDELRAVLGHGLDFWAWRSLHRQGLDNHRIARLMRNLATPLLRSPVSPASP